MSFTPVITPSCTVGQGRLAVFAGPCVAESREICFQVAEFLASACERLGVQYVFKASFDKANRSSGTSFRGPGMKAGLDILAAVKDRFGLPVVTDVHESAQAAATQAFLTEFGIVRAGAAAAQTADYLEQRRRSL
jgi:2-dehydro-3-deoxyphosphooctonate aldolase (KDO 8-P synthase)